MAKCKNPLMSMSASGALGGIEYRNGIYGPMCGRRSISANTSSNAQRNQRSLLTTSHRAWENLSDANQAAWSTMTTPPISGRNLFIATYTRWLMAGLPDQPLPQRHSSIDKIGPITMTPFSSNPPVVVLTHTYSGDIDSFLLIYTLASYSHRQTPTPSKLTFSMLSAAWGGYHDVPVKCAAPVIHCRLEIIDSVNGQTLGITLIRSIIDWSGV